MFSRVEDILTKNPTIPQSRVEYLLLQLMEGLPTDEHIRDLVGSPLKADTVSEMTDDTKIYIYTGSETGYTAGHWYYYNGSSWADGGVYNSAGINTDKTLSVEDKAADGKAVGDELTDLKSDLSDLQTEIDDVNDDLYDYEEQDVDETTTTANLEFTAGYVSNTGDTGGTSSYQHTKKIAVNEGDVVKYITGSYNLEIRFICAYNGESVVSSKGSSSQVTSFTVPSGVTHIVLSVTNNNVISGALLHRYYTTNVKTFDVGEFVRSLKELDVESLSDKVDEITESVEESETSIIEPEFTKHNGYWWGGESASGSYTYTALDVQEGDVIQCFISATGLVQELRFADAYLDSTRVSSKSVQSVNSYTVPSGVNKVYLSINLTSESYYFSVTRTTITVVTKPTGVDELESAVKVLTKNGFVISAEKDTLASGTELVLDKNIDNRMNATLDLWAKFDTFDSVTVGHGLSTYGGYITVDNTNAIVYYNGSAMKTYTHGLTISDFIEIHVIQRDAAYADFVIQTATGRWNSTEDALWHGCKDKIVAKATMALSDVRFSAAFKDFKKDCIIFGDSYTTVGDPSRWPSQAISKYKASNFALVGFGGASSANEILSFRNIIQKVKPLWVGWFLGMNDPDTSSAANASWKSCVEEVISTCEKYGITPVLATIPCTPTQRNDHKNTYVRNSGYAYVDFAKAVNGEAVGATWYTGMLSSDNVHPAELGAKALAARLVADMPQII